MDAAEYKHVVLGLIFLKYISDAFEETARRSSRPSKAKAPTRKTADEYRAENVFWVPKEARWAHLQAKAKQPTIGKLVDEAMVAIERDNPALKGVLPKDYARPALDKQRLGELIDLIGTIGLGDAENRSKDILGRVYEYFLSQFASAEGQEGRPVLHAALRGPRAGRDARALQGPRLRPLLRLRRHVRAEREVRRGPRTGGKRSATSAIYGQESNPTTWRLAKMNLAIRGIDGDLGPNTPTASTATCTRTSRPTTSWPIRRSTISDWGGERLRDDVRWKYGTPPAGNANFAWVQHFIHHLAPDRLRRLRAGQRLDVVQPVGRRARSARRIVEADLVDCMVALPGQLFYSTQIPVCLWFLARNKKNGEFRDRRGETLFIDARKLGTLIDRVHRELTDEDIARIAGTYHAWRGDKDAGKYADVPGFCKSATTERSASTATS